MIWASLWNVFALYQGNSANFLFECICARSKLIKRIQISLRLDFLRSAAETFKFSLGRGAVEQKDEWRYDDRCEIVVN